MGSPTAADCFAIYRQSSESGKSCRHCRRNPFMLAHRLVKNIFLRNNRTFSRKAVEMVLALILERKLSKSKILGSYLGKIYWGHGIYGIESASYFYFGKHPVFLTLGESALLAGMIPSPELRSPFNDLSRGKISEARALRRMVDDGFLDIEVALSTVNENLDLHGDGEELTKTLIDPLKQEPTELDIWNWRKESKIWEVKEYMDTWAMRARQRKYARESNVRIHSICLYEILVHLVRWRPTFDTAGGWKTGMIVGGIGEEKGFFCVSRRTEETTFTIPVVEDLLTSVN